jgi:hypothetical protein
MAGDVLETESMQQTEDETRKADWASRIQHGRWLPLRLGGVARRGTRKGCVSKQLRITAAQAKARTPSPRHVNRTDPTPRRHRSARTGTGLFSSLVVRDGSASREAWACRGWQPIEGEMHGDITAVCMRSGHEA